jgi:hypothetical protein
VRPVEQTTFYDGSSGQRGNCTAACVASIFERPLEEVDSCVPPGSSWSQVDFYTRRVAPFLSVHAIDLCLNHRQVEEATERHPQGRWTYDLPPADAWERRWESMGLWIAAVVSPRGTLRDGPYRDMPIQHAVVMRGSELAWDPHPDRDLGVGQVLEMCWWVCPDPAMALAR